MWREEAYLTNLLIEYPWCGNQLGSRGFIVAKVSTIDGSLLRQNLTYRRMVHMDIRWVIHGMSRIRRWSKRDQVGETKQPAFMEFGSVVRMDIDRVMHGACGATCYSGLSIYGYGDDDTTGEPPP